MTPTDLLAFFASAIGDTWGVLLGLYAGIVLVLVTVRLITGRF